MEEISYFDQIKDQLDNGEIVDEIFVNKICTKLAEILYTEENILELQSPITICGDIHGQYEDLLELFDTAGGFEQKYLFMGDYVDRGYYSLNTFLLLATLKLKYPNKYYLLRGNHECRAITKTYGFYFEITQNYGTSALWSRIMDIFDLLPVCAIVDNDIFSVHGGLSPSLPIISFAADINRKTELPSSGIFSDLLWSDPTENPETVWALNKRGAGYSFGNKVIEKFCHINRLRLITRSHQVSQKGYTYYCPNHDKEPEGKLLLVWSAPNYQYTDGNMASVLRVGYTAQDRFNLRIFGPRDNKLRIKTENPLCFNSIYFA
ncbi:Serine/threonine-protein phosphatase 4 catalytic subunit [Tritrichomonas foetus]|uniref:Serine/threonine-protein phosphatase n=1 Tax=Tritrichomonas foetus TaxID=1144522 RepID=A0A1J4JFJ6_9EUKA|nr:Serine/threonine-protein phosphatase 4 catalytic subunit [Tritrichomonas foetus]|eukprot:OHS97441.1 Serine/threonine-protein phosphatase 4 catalytic subunit [Tritrichomonas foetus]